MKTFVRSFAVTGWTEPGPARDAVKIAENVAAIRSFNPEGFTVYTLDERLVQALEYRPIDGQISKIIFSGKTAGVRWDRR